VVQSALIKKGKGGSVIDRSIGIRADLGVC